MDTTPQEITLLTVANGAAPELFARELLAVLSNIQDLNANPKTKRKITLEFVFTPSPNRESAGVVVNAKSALAQVNPVAQTVFLATRGGEFVAVGYDIRQNDMFREEPQVGGVTPIIRTTTANGG